MKTGKYDLYIGSCRPIHSLIKRKASTKRLEDIALIFKKTISRKYETATKTLDALSQTPIDYTYSVGACKTIGSFFAQLTSTCDPEDLEKVEQLKQHFLRCNSSARKRRSFKLGYLGFYQDKTFELPESSPETQTLNKTFQQGDYIYGLHGTIDSILRNGNLYGNSDRVKHLKCSVNDLLESTYSKRDHNQEQSQLKIDFLSSISTHPKYDQSMELKTWKSIRRKCKYAISFNVTRNKNIHFLLSGLNQQNIMDQRGLSNNDSDPTNPKYALKSITGSELKYIYRNWNNQSFKKHVYFYELQNGTPVVVKPPWITNPTLWKPYIPKKWQLVDV